MKVLLDLLRRTRRFRVTFSVVLVAGFLLALSGTRTTPEASASGGESPPALEATPGEEGGAGLPVAQVAELPAEADGTRSPEPASDTEGAATEAKKEAAPAVAAAPPDDEQLARLGHLAETFLRGLSRKISKTPEAADATLTPELQDLAAGDAADSESLRGRLGDADKAGGVIHIYRRFGFVPLASVRWTELLPGGERPDAGGDGTKADRIPTVALLGIVTVADEPRTVQGWVPRSKAIKVIFEIVGEKALIREVTRPSIEELHGAKVVETFLDAMRKDGAAAAWALGSEPLKRTRDAKALKREIDRDGFLASKSIAWGDASALEGGFKLAGVATLDDGYEMPFYAALLETEGGLKLLDLQSTTTFFSRLTAGHGDSLDISLAVVATALLLGFLYILLSYFRGLGGSPRELYILFFTKVTEYSAYGAAQLAFMFYLREDIGMGDIGAGSYYSIWSTVVTATTMAVGAICDAIGIKKTLLLGSFALLLSRAVMPFANNIWIATIFGFLPLGIGIAITGPVLSVGIKRFTTLEGASLGFGLFYTLMNVGWAIGAQLFDVVRIRMGEMGTVSFLGDTLTPWQVIFGIGFFINLPDLAVILWMRDGVEMTESGIRFPTPKEVRPEEKLEGSYLSRGLADLKGKVLATAKIMGENFVQRAFWVFILLISITVFARLTFFHFHITWPSYGIRYFGQGSLVGNIFGVLNPVMIVFLVPVIAYVTRRVRSYWMLLVGTIVSVSSIFFVVLPVETFAGLGDTWFGAVIFDRWLEVPVGLRDPFYLSMVLFVMAFTVGEAIWSPRLMQFTAEIAPPGREGSYISLSYLPYFGAKFIAGPMAGFLLSNYAPEFGVDGVYGNYPDHQMIWWWIGGMAALTPIGLFLLRKVYHTAEARAEAAAREAAAQEGA